MRPLELDQPWIRYEPRQLHELMTEHPMTEENLHDTLVRGVTSVTFSYVRGTALAGFTIHDGTPRPVRIFILKSSDALQRLTLLHELVHIRYRASAGGLVLSSNGRAIEDLVDREARRFLSSNGGYLDQNYDRLYSSLPASGTGTVRIESRYAPSLSYGAKST